MATGVLAAAKCAHVLPSVLTVNEAGLPLTADTVKVPSDEVAEYVGAPPVTKNVRLKAAPQLAEAVGGATVNGTAAGTSKTSVTVLVAPTLSLTVMVTVVSVAGTATTVAVTVVPATATETREGWLEKAE